MKIREMIMDEVADLDSNALLRLYEYMSILKIPTPAVSENNEENISLRTVQDRLSESKSDWALDLINERNDRI